MKEVLKREKEDKKKKSEKLSFCLWFVVPENFCSAGLQESKNAAQKQKKAKKEAEFRVTAHGSHRYIRYVSLQLQLQLHQYTFS